MLQHKSAQCGFLYPDYFCFFWISKFQPNLICINLKNKKFFIFYFSCHLFLPCHEIENFKITKKYFFCFFYGYLKTQIILVSEVKFKLYKIFFFSPSLLRSFFLWYIFFSLFSFSLFFPFLFFPFLFFPFLFFLVPILFHSYAKWYVWT